MQDPKLIRISNTIPVETIIEKLAKLGNGLDKSLTVMVGGKKKKKNLGNNRGKLERTWASSRPKKLILKT